MPIDPKYDIVDFIENKLPDTKPPAEENKFLE